MVARPARARSSTMDALSRIAAARSFSSVAVVMAASSSKAVASSARAWFSACSSSTPTSGLISPKRACRESYADRRSSPRAVPIWALWGSAADGARRPPERAAGWSFPRALLASFLSGGAYPAEDLLDDLIGRALA